MRERARRAFGTMPIGTALGKVRAIIGTRFPRSERLATEALESLWRGEVPSDEGWAALEQMIRIMRPALISTDAVLRRYPDYHAYPPGTLSAWESFRGAVKPWLYSIGRIDQGECGTGTGFLVSPRLLATNYHVVRELDFIATSVRFKCEYGTVDDLDPVAITGIAAKHSTLDLVLLRLEHPVPQPPLQLESEPPQPGSPVVAIGYPMEDTRNPALAHSVFEGDYGWKRAAPGEITATEADALYHDCSTLGGNSGSPLLSLSSVRVVGMHRHGDFLDRNEAVPGPDVAAFVQSHLAGLPADP
jgi:S1-C subfamily serine protease